MSKLVKITIFPIKSLNGINLEKSRILSNSALENDRRFKLVDKNSNVINAKRTQEIHRISAKFDLQNMGVKLSVNGLPGEDSLNLAENISAVGEWFSDYFGEPVYLKENKEGGFPDDTLYDGPTIISTQTIKTVSGWFADLNEEEMRARLRTNLEINVNEPFWEDHLFSDKERDVNFSIGDVLFRGGNPCQRCVVPGRDTHTGKSSRDFQQILMQKREELLPSWSNKNRFDHYYRLAVNVRINDLNQCNILRTGDNLVLDGQFI